LANGSVQLKYSYIAEDTLCFALEYKLPLNFSTMKNTTFIDETVQNMVPNKVHNFQGTGDRSK
jgi:hypothetical protein